MYSSAKVRPWRKPAPVCDDAMENDPRTDNRRAGWVKRRVSTVWAKVASQRAMNFAFLDQVMVSGCNFLSAILLARAFGIYEFGRFTLAWMFVEFIGSLQFAAIIQPMLNIGPKQADADSDRYYHAVVAQQGAACALLGILVWAGATFAGWLFADPEIHRLAVPISAAIITYQLHCFFRRYFFARDRTYAVLCNDVLRFATQIAATLALPFAWPGATAVAGIWIVAAACAVAAIHGAVLFGRPGWNTAIFRNVLARHWEFSKWLLPSALMFWMTSQGFLVMSGLVLGAAATGGLRAAMSITGVLNILLLALDNFAPVQAARAFHLGGPAELRRYIARLALLTVTLTAVTVAMLNIAPRYLVHLLYGDQYEGVDTLVRWLCALSAVYGISAVLIIWAAAIEWTRIIFVSYAAATAFTVVAAYPLTLYGGLAGVVFGSMIVEIIRVVVLLIPLACWSRRTQSEKSKSVSNARQTLTRDELTTDLAMDLKDDLTRCLLWSLSASGLPRLMAKRHAGEGGILSFHRVYRPNRHEFSSQTLSVAPENFRRIVQTLIGRGYRFLSMSALASRLQNPEAAAGKFICLTFDDGFVDNYTEAFPICRELGVPMTVYLVSSFVRREFPMWSFGLEAAIAAHDVIEFTWEGEELRLNARTMRQKQQAYFAIASRFVIAPPEKIRQACTELSCRYGIDFMALGDHYALTPTMIAEMQASGLVEFGSHGVHHAHLGRLADSAARWEITQGKRDCEALLGAEVRHFAYPYGNSDAAGPREVAICRELGFCTAVTSRSNTIFSSNRDQLMALPRLTYNGKYQDTPLLDLLLSGTLPRLRQGLRTRQRRRRSGFPTSGGVRIPD
jgi:O-antigen/teichoic acid export membrane protein/peptidoglycan/xylan/chitin deacetylase (PgdA/CDA1 family)